MQAIVKNILSNPYTICTGILFICVFSLASAYIAQYVFDLEPCILCLYQRPPYYAAGFLAIIGIFLAKKSLKIPALTVLLCSIIFFAGAVIAFYHTGVEQHWWSSFLEGCAIDFDALSNLEALENKPAVRCDEIPWSDPILGLSMANYNTIASLGYCFICAISSVLIIRKANGY